MKNKSPTTKLCIALIVATFVIIINDLYAEYCVSREFPLFLTSIATILIVLLDIWALIQLVKLIKSTLKF